MHVCIDTKNLALYEGGIAAYARPLINAWVAAWPSVRFTTLGPRLGEPLCAGRPNHCHAALPWPDRLWRPLRHPVYDNVLFPEAVGRIAPDWLFSFYHDVGLPTGGGRTRSIMMVHDTCLQDVPAVYPRRVRYYLQRMLQRNLPRAAHILTVSQASREAILKRYEVAPNRVHVVYNAIERVEDSSTGTVLGGTGGASILYSGGTDVRKNLPRLLGAFERLVNGGRDVQLCITGSPSSVWHSHMVGLAPTTVERVRFLGRLSDEQMRTAYREADAVVYPTLCEGFGRVCIEAMAEGAPLACSDLAVLREVAGAYPFYFDPLDESDIARVIDAALERGRLAPVLDERFEVKAVTASFLTLMDGIMMPS